MNATGAGKTVFLLSYFYSAMQLGRGTHSIAINNNNAMLKLTKAIDNLINNGVPPVGTSEYNDMSFTVGGTMNINLFDVPGGDTQGLASKVAERLRAAKGAIFFIDGEDLVHKPEKVLRDNIAFGKAITMLRENTFKNVAGRILGRQDVPVWFVITKCDAIPEITDEQLQKHLAALLKSASEDKGSGKWAEKLFSKGKRVRIFRTQSMGKWLSPQTPPTAASFNPINVTEAMDSLLDEMRKSESGYRRLLMLVLAGMGITAAVAGVVFTYTTISQTDHLFWRAAMGRVDKAIAQENYTEARREIDGFISPAYMGFYPKFWRADTLKTSEAYPKLEEAMYAEIMRRFSAINFDIMPEVTPQFSRNKELVDEYLNIKQFQTVAKTHYQQVKDKEWYFRGGSDYGYAPSQTDTPDDVIKAIERCLNRDYTTPASWREMERVKLEGLLRAWINKLPTNVDVEELNVYASSAEQLINNPSMPQVLKDYLKDQQSRWANLKSDQWRQAAEGWITEALRLPVQDSIRALNTHLAKSEISDAARDRLRGALDDLYLKQADEWVKRANELTSSEGVRDLEVRRKTAGSDAAREHIDSAIVALKVREAEDWIAEAQGEKVALRSGIAKLNEHLAKNLIPEARSVLENGLVNLWNHQADEWLREANNSSQASQGINVLKSALAQADMPQTVKARLERSLENLQTREADELVSQAMDLRDSGRAEDAVRLLQGRVDREGDEVMRSRLERELASLREWLVDKWIEDAENSPQLDRAIADLTMHLKEPGISDSDRTKLDDKIYSLEGRLNAEWVNEAQKFSPEDRIAVLVSYYDRAPTENVIDRMQREIDNTYNEIIAVALNEYPDDVQRLRELVARLSRGREIPAQVRDTLQSAITAAETKARDAYMRAVLQKIGAAETFGELGRVLHDSDIDTDNDAVQTQVSLTAQKLLGNELTRIQNGANDYANTARYADARKYVESEFEKLSSGISYALTPTRNVQSAILARVQVSRGEFLDSLATAHLRACRVNFDARRRSSTGISASISDINVFLAVWGDTTYVNEATRVLTYLKAIDGGISGYFSVTRGTFTNTGRTFDTPDIRVTVSGAVRVSTEVVENNAQPYFGNGVPVTWKPNMGLITIRAYEVDTIGDDLQCFDVTINPSGWDGWRVLDRTYSSNSNTITVNFSGSVPSCPW